MIELGVKMAWGLKAGWITQFDDRAGPTRVGGHRRGGLFPLPLVIPADIPWVDASQGTGYSMELGTAAWVALKAARL